MLRVFQSDRPLPRAWAAYDWEYRWRGAFMFLSQGVVLAWRLITQGSLALPVEPWTGVIAVVLTAISVGARVWGTGIITAATMVSMDARSDRLVSHGVFGLVRNPLYLGDVLTFTSYALLLHPPLVPVFGIYHVVRVLRLIAHEEQFLAAHWSAPYAEYCRRVPRLIPRLARVEPGDVCWKNGWIGSTIWVGFLTGYIAAAVTGNLWSLSPFETAGFLYAAYYFSRNTTAPASAASDASSSG
jgi:protein-S-isoprenylcysteine O-methyltransferase Ste14